jgi:TonB family protein
MPLVAVLLASFGMHLLLWPLGDEVLDMTWSGRELPQTDRAMEVALLDEDEIEEEIDPEAPPPAEPPGKLVQLDKVTDQRPPEHETPYVSEFDSRAAHPTRAPNDRPQPGAPAQPRGDRPDGRKGEGEAPDPLQPQALPLMPSRDNRGDESTEAQDDGELSAPGGQVPLPSASGTPGTRKALRDALGRPGGFDDVDPSVDEDDETKLDSKRWKFASFFNRVRNGVAQHWHPEVLHASNDPDGRKYGTKTRRTRLVISLNPDGSLNRVRLDSSSDVDYLDDEAIRAVRTAAPFANPPPGLVDPRTGLIEFAFGFIFEFKGENRIFRYQR